MPNHVCNGAMLKCSFGMAPSSLVVLPANRMTTLNQPAANIMDHIPNTNIMPFGMCQSLANPAVAAATSAALGTLTPQMCTPMTMSPWVKGAPKTTLAMMPALDDISKLTCSFGGMIEITNAGQTKETIA